MKDDIGEQNDVQCETTASTIFKTQKSFLIDFTDTNILSLESMFNIEM